MTWSEQIRDRAAFTSLYRAHEPAVFRFALSMTGDRGIAAEITQDVFVWLIHHPDAFDPARGQLTPFLLGVARKFLLRHAHTDPRLVPLEGHDHPAEGIEDDRPSVLALRAAIAALPGRYREVVILCDLEGLTYEEAAVALGCVTGTVRSRLHRARQFLSRKLGSKKQTQSKRQTQRCTV
jgi:RNA polymerase sigma-70 factor (ECF subfamily)